MIKNYLLAAKPKIVFGNLVSSAGGFFLASKGRVDIPLLLLTLIGISLVVASGCVFNNYVDRDIDRKMIRTRNRPLAKGTLSSKAAVLFASFLGIAGMSLLWISTTILSSAIVLSGFAIYVGVYSLYLKRYSVYGTFVGSLAGAAPPLAGYCAVSNRFDLGAVILLLVFSLWQMPHWYAIAIYRFDDYVAALIPTLPVRQGVAAARKHIICYILAFMASTLMLTIGGYTGYTTFAVAAALSLSWLHMAWLGYKKSDERIWAKKLCVFSVLSIFMLSIMMSIDCTVPTTPDMPKRIETGQVGPAQLSYFFLRNLLPTKRSISCIHMGY